MAAPIARFGVVVVDALHQIKREGTLMIVLRRTLAAPLYVIAFVFYLLMEVFTWAAMTISGDNDPASESESPPAAWLT
jgi:hypothetical protein